MEGNKQQKIFAKGICFSKLFWIFVIGCVVGTYYEQFLTLFTIGVWESRQGVIYGPFNPVYGFGMLIMVWALHNQKDWKRLLLFGALAGGGFEYLLSFLQEYFIGSRSWDYTNHLLNINGRTTIPFALFWGLLTIIVVKFVYPVLSKGIEKIPYTFGTIITIVFTIFLSADMILTGAVLLRQGARNDGKEPYTVVGEWIDKVYTDEYLENVFPNMAKQQKNKANSFDDEKHYLVVQSNTNENDVYIYRVANENFSDFFILQA